MTDLPDKRPIAIRAVLPFVFRHWLLQPYRAALVLAGFLGATAADLFMSIYSGHLVNALTSALTMRRRDMRRWLPSAALSRSGSFP